MRIKKMYQGQLPENKIVNIQSNSQTDTYSCDYINDMIYPVGSIYMSVNNTNPSTLFGGTWEQLKDRFLLGAGSTYSNGATGGSATHKLTINEMPEHQHYIERPAWVYAENDDNGAVYSPYDYGTSSKYTTYTNAVGGSKAHNNMPPYLVVYMWKRTA